MKRSISRLAALAAALLTAVMLLVAGTGSAQAAGRTIHGCPSGAVCVYPQAAGWNHDRPSLMFWSYGAHNLSNQYGNHLVFSNQYGDAYAYACRGYNGTKKWSQGYSTGFFVSTNLTPINSIVLTPRWNAQTCGGQS